MIKEDQQWSKTSKKENLKEMGDVTSGMASTVIQLYLKPILDCFINAASGVRQAAFRVTQLILQQGLVSSHYIIHQLKELLQKKILQLCCCTELFFFKK